MNDPLEVNISVLIEKIEQNIPLLEKDIRTLGVEEQDILIKEAIKFDREDAFKKIIQIRIDNKYNIELIPIEYILQINAQQCLKTFKKEIQLNHYIGKLKQYFNVPFLFENVELGLFLENEIKQHEPSWSSIKDYKEIFLEAIDLENTETFHLLINKEEIFTDQKLLKYGHKLSILRENPLHLTINNKLGKNLLNDYSEEEVNEQIIKAIYKDRKKAIEIYYNHFDYVSPILETLYPDVIERLSISIIKFLIDKQIPINELALESLEKIKNSTHMQADYIHTIISKTEQYQRLEAGLKEKTSNKKRVKI